MFRCMGMICTGKKTKRLSADSRRFSQIFFNFMERDAESFAVIGAAMEVHRELKSGFLEAVYQDALEIEFSIRTLPFQREVKLPVFYKGQKLTSFYRADFVVYNSLIIEVKAIDKVGRIEEAQAINYLRITGLTKSLILNFGTQSLQYKRLVLTPPKICGNLRESVDNSFSQDFTL
jgi:GxxExxY protein